MMATPGTAATTTALVTAKSMHPLATWPVPRWALGAGAAGLLGLVVVLVLALRDDHPIPSAIPSQAAAPATREPARPAPPAIASIAPAPAPLSIDDLPAAEPKPQPLPATSVARPVAVPAVPPTKAAIPPALPAAKPKPVATADPFAGRD